MSRILNIPMIGLISLILYVIINSSIPLFISLTLSVVISFIAITGIAMLFILNEHDIMELINENYNENYDANYSIGICFICFILSLFGSGLITSLFWVVSTLSLSLFHTVLNKKIL